MPTELKGVRQLRKTLRKFEPDLSKALQQQMTAALKPIVVKARGFIPAQSPLSKWEPRSFTEGRFPFYDAKIMKRGISYKTSPTKPDRHGFSYAASIHNKTASGAIFETAGRKNPAGQPRSPLPKGMKETRKRYNRSNNPRAGEQFIDALNRESPLAQGSTRFSRPGSGRRGRKMMGRAIFRAWSQDQGQANTAVLNAIKDSAYKFRSRKGTF